MANVAHEVSIQRSVRLQKSPGRSHVVYPCRRTSLKYLSATTPRTKCIGLAVSVTYYPGGGLCNQLVGIINTFAVAYAAQASVQLQPSAYRDSFNTLYHNINWTTSDISSILDIKRMRQYWSGHGMSIDDYLNMTAFPVHGLQSQSRVLAEMNLHDQPSRHLLSWANRVHAAALIQIGEAMDDNTSLAGHLTVTVNLGWPTERIKISSHANVFARVLKSMVFAPNLERIAINVIDKLNQLAPSFNGVHLRIEDDYVHHPYLDHQNTCNNSLHCLDAQYVPAMKRAKFTQQVPLFVASGIFTARPEYQLRVVQTLIPFGSCILHKEDLVDKQELDYLNSEQLAVIDFMLMRRTAKFVGVFDSSFSKLVARFRETDGHESSTNTFARDFDATRVDLS